MPLNIGTAFADLLSNPAHFLGRHPVSIAAHAHGASTFYAQEMHRPTGTRTTSVLKRTVGATDGLRIWTTPGGPPVQAYSVQMTAWGGAAAGLNWLNVPAPAMNLPKFIFTGQLTGCSFVVQDAGGGAVQCAHAQHGAGLNSAALRTTLGTGGYTSIYGHGAEYDAAVNQVFILGAAIGGTWQIYAQKLSGTNAILGVDRLF